ncbi:sensor histidine kinase [Agarilytica rhodophyticola]|uniref:sensor histidine kinase n=1 Tax=Agarilytica rhodophyticola TaxID=1737490 RepID=UPI001FE30873|nr:histidine kinase [Agarilytica rhodophyticola]
MILVGELLSFAFVVIKHGIFSFNWVYFGSVSFLVQWIILSSAACLCPLRSWLGKQNGIVAGSISYGLVLLMTLIFTSAGLWLMHGQQIRDNSAIAENLIIAAIFAGVVLRYFYLQQQLQNREQVELRSRIQALQSRIRPHFLFNSMNSIASLIDIDPKAAEKMVIDLSQLFRASLNEPTIVPLEEEIKLCQQFVSIEQTRLGKRLVVDWEIDIQEIQASIPSLLLQPLIENAIYHGIQPLPNGGVVSVKIVATASEVRVGILNPSPVANHTTGKNSNGMALENIRHRLDAHFGDQATLELNQENEKFSVQLAYPVKDLT